LTPLLNGDWRLVIINPSSPSSSSSSSFLWSVLSF
jgi:hypothetical protein